MAGIGEQIKGKAKDLAGDALNKPDLEREGEAQVDKGTQENKASEAKAEAQAHEKKADAYKEEQEQAENA